MFYFHYWFGDNTYSDRFFDNKDNFFEMLGSGSADEVPEGSDDDAATEEENSRQGV